VSGAGNLRKYRKSQKAFLRSEERFQERSLEKGGPCRYEAGATLGVDFRKECLTETREVGLRKIDHAADGELYNGLRQRLHVGTPARRGGGRLSRYD